MRYFEKDIVLKSLPANINIRPFADIHFGADGFDKELFFKFIQEAERDKNGMTICGGDVTDDDRPSTRLRRRIMYHDRIEALEHEDKTHMSWLDKEVIPLFKRLAKAGLGCLGMLDGDHYRLYSNGMTSTEYICARANIPYLGEGMAWVRLKFNRNVKDRICYLIHIQHGKGGTTTVSGDINKILNTGYDFRGELFLAAHTHKELAYRTIELYPDKCGNIKEKQKWHVRMGSFLKGYVIGRPTYVEDAHYRPLHRGWPIVHIKLCQYRPNKVLGYLVKVTT